MDTRKAPALAVERGGDSRQQPGADRERARPPRPKTQDAALHRLKRRGFAYLLSKLNRGISARSLIEIDPESFEPAIARPRLLCTSEYRRSRER
jgi:hypothetical protein